MKKCTGKEWDTCRVEKMGCYGCAYNDNDMEILEATIDSLKNAKPFKYTNEQKANAIEHLIKRVKDLEQNDKKEKFEFKMGGRDNGKTLNNAITFIKYLDELETNKMYGIMKCGRSITLLTKEKVITQSKIKKKIQEFKEVRDEILKREAALKIPSVTYDLRRNDYCEKMLEELLQEGDK